ncbi:MAG TPA: tetratricopeptide repeat protein [Thermoanaerobaculia bacterium]|nr:tetratricopeptide repeat protein [Thermoanaerobaculia bacterium]
MRRQTILMMLAAAILAARCADTSSTPPPAVVPTAADRYLIDPRIGWSPVAPQQLDDRFETAWRFYLAGDYPQARMRLDELRTKNPEYGPAVLAEAMVLRRQGDTTSAQATVERLLAEHPDYTAAQVLRAELAVADKQTRRAYELYRDLARQPDAPATAAERLRELETQLFNELFAAANAAQGEESIPLLREVLQLQPGASAPRILLAQRLIGLKQYDEARRELDPVINSGDVDGADVQEALAEIEVGRGRYQEAIIRYERLARRTNDRRYADRLEDIKETWNAMNMPPHYQRALESEAITRADLAVLLYWKVASVRFAQNLGAPPIAIDIGDVAGREEVVRALALGILNVDPVTRRVGPYTPVTAASLGRFAQRVLTMRGAPCAKTSNDKVLSACGVQDPTVTALSPEAPVSGRAAAGILEQVDKALR